MTSTWRRARPPSRQGRPEGPRQFPSTPSARAITARTAAAIGSASITPRPPRRGCRNRPTRTCPQARARFRRPSPTGRSPPCAAACRAWCCGSSARPFATASSSTPRMRGRSASNAAHSSCSGRRRSSGIGSSVRNTARSARSGRVTMSSMPFRITGRAASNSTSS